MNKLNTILVGVDFSDCSRCALEQAARLARWNDASMAIRPHFGISDGSLLNYRLVIRRGAARLSPVIEHL